jgi:hypothetical protein
LSRRPSERLGADVDAAAGVARTRPARDAHLSIATGKNGGVIREKICRKNDVTSSISGIPTTPGRSLVRSESAETP